MFKNFILLFLFLFTTFVSTRSLADEGISIIRDQEVEDLLYFYTRPMFKVSGLVPDTLQIYLIKDNNINAFTSKGSMIFVNTGLITRANHQGELVGVLAHETGHVAGGHLVRLYDNMKIANRNYLISSVLGSLAAIATGRPDVGMAVIMGGQHAALMGHLSYRQSEENAADEIATRILDRTGYSFQGFLQVMKKLIEQDKINLSQNNSSYLRTHPLSEERAKFFVDKINLSKHKDDSLHQSTEEKFQRIKAKLIAFLSPPYRTLMIYDKQDNVWSRYAVAIAYYRMGDLDKALSLMDELLAQNPTDSYFYELKGQMLFEHGQTKASLAPYAKAVSLNPNGNLIRISYAAALIESGTVDNAKIAITHLEKVLQTEKDDITSWRLLASAANITKDEGLKSFAMAEYNYLIGNIEGAKIQIQRAEKLLPPKSPKYYQLMDLKEALENLPAPENP